MEVGEAGKWLLRELGAWPWLVAGQVPLWLLPGRPCGLVGSTMGQRRLKASELPQILTFGTDASSNVPQLLQIQPKG